jgi:uncharacterized phage protein (TIGR01671 family)
MSREIKQRFWDGERFRFPEYYSIETKKYFDTYRDLENNTPIFNLKTDEFTGLTDKNGKEIYEGDIYEFSYDIKNYDDDDIMNPRNNFIHQYSTITTRHLVEYKICGFNAISDCIVVGNIHENPELLKQ